MMSSLVLDKTLTLSHSQVNIAPVSILCLGQNIKPRGLIMNKISKFARRTFITSLGMGLFVFALAGPSAMAGHHGMKKTEMDVVDTAIAAGSFNTLVTAIKAAGLVDTLKGDGPFTVFAPTDEAFKKIPEDQLAALLKDKTALTKVLTYHVVPGKVMAADVVTLDSAKTVEGQSVTISNGDGVKVDNANVVKTDIVASNGVIHVIDEVIMPK
jgi:uncharacterized surface protein with fasciclin (FAS1) repeats